jgi:HSP20 family molecular chaperone IbpA
MKNALENILFNGIEALVGSDSFSQSMPTNITDTEDIYSFHTLLPGLDKEEVKVTIEENHLKIATIDNKNIDAAIKTLRKEFLSKNMERNFLLPNDADANNVNASLEQGVLNVKIGKLKKHSDTISITIS